MGKMNNNKTRTLATLTLALCAAAMLAAFCTEFDFDHPLDANGTDYRPTHTLTVNAGNGGTVSPSGTSERRVGSQVTVTATASGGNMFTGWTGTGAPTPATTNPATVTMNGNKTLTANFTPVGGCTQGVNCDNDPGYCRDGGGCTATTRGNCSANGFSQTQCSTTPGTISDTATVFVEGGTFTMGCTAEQGSSDCWDDEKPTHSVTVSSFYIMKYEVTQKLWKDVMGTGSTSWTSCGSYGVGNYHPAYCVSWNDIVNNFIPALNQKTGKTYRLPTEAEWEYAARGGKQSKGYKYAGSNNTGSVAWYWDNSSSGTKPVGGKAPNELGIYDMSGNVWEWVSDWYSGTYYSTSPSDNPQGPTTGSIRVNRGGGWGGDARGARVSFRGNGDPGGRDGNLGFRLVLVSP